MIKNKLLLSLFFALALTGNLVGFEQETRPNSFWQNRKLELKGLKNGIVPSWALNPAFAALPCSAGIAYWNEIIMTPQDFAVALVCAVLTPVLLHHIFDTPEKIATRAQKIIDEVDDLFENKKIDINFSTYLQNKNKIDRLINKWIDTIQNALDQCKHALECSNSEQIIPKLNLLIEELTKRKILFVICLTAYQFAPELIEINT